MNPKTNRPGICRATKTCPFGGDEIHFETKEAALEASTASLRTLAPTTKKKLSAGASLVLKLAKAQNVIIEKSKENLGYGDPTLRKAVEVRNRLQDRLAKDIPWDDSDAPDFNDDETVEVTSDFITDDSPRMGYSNDFIKFDRGEAEVYETLDAASNVWLKRLSTAEVKAIILYNLSADDYAKITAGQQEPTDEHSLLVKHLHGALAKAPRTSQPYIAYSGVSEHRQEAIAEQAELGAIEFSRVQSASLNPAQVNQFSHYNEEDAVILELKLNRVASLSLFNIHRGEMEVLAPLGNYQVVNKLSNVEYCWNEKSRRRMGRTYQADFRD